MRDTSPRSSPLSVDSALESLGARTWSGPKRNPRIEEYIAMSASNRLSFSKRQVWIGALATLLCGGVVGAAITTVVVEYSFVGSVVLPDGSTRDVAGTLQMEQVGGDDANPQYQATVSLDGLPEGGEIQAGTLTLEDGTVMQVVPVDGGAEFTLPACSESTSNTDK